jgi:hypothetical protein
MTCHTVSADGSTLISGGGVFGGSYNLSPTSPSSRSAARGARPERGRQQPVVIQWSNSGALAHGQVHPDELHGRERSHANDGGPGFRRGCSPRPTAMPVTTSGVMAVPFAAPAWSPGRNAHRLRGRGDPTGGTRRGTGRTAARRPQGHPVRRDGKNPMFSGRRRWSRWAPATRSRGRASRPTASGSSTHAPAASTRATATGTSTWRAP